jgi:hypothetical protein
LYTILRTFPMFIRMVINKSICAFDESLDMVVVVVE